MADTVEVGQSAKQRRCVACSKLIPANTRVYVRRFEVSRATFFVPGEKSYDRAHFAHLSCGQQWPACLGRATPAELPVVTKEPGH